MAAMSVTLARASALALKEAELPLASGKSTFAGVRVAPSKAAHSSSSAAFSKTNVVVRASADGTQQQAAAQFASVAESTAPPPAAAPSPLLVPAALGAGIVGGIALNLLGKSSAVTAAASPAAEVVASLPLETSNGALKPFVKRAAPAALAKMAEVFPNAMQEDGFIKSVAAELFNLGFRKDNCIALVNTCRDEVCRPLVGLIDREFGLSFNVSGLGGLVNCGKTGFKAAMSHSPVFPCDFDGRPRERYIFFGFPHVSIGESGEVGSLLRRGRGKPSSACGALIAIKNDISKGASLEEDPDDLEYTLLRRKVVTKLASVADGGPDLVKVTKAALQSITDDIETLVSLTVDPDTADYAVITGVQIHSGNQIPGEPFRIERTCDYIAPNAMYAVIKGKKQILHCEIDQIATISSVPADDIKGN